MNNINIRTLKNKLNTNIKKFTLYNDALIYTDDYGIHVVKENINNISDIYNYLKSRGFNYLPEIEYIDNNIYVYKYMNNIIMPNEQRASDLVKLDALLHNKTVYYVDMSLDEIKETYEKLNTEIENTLLYYEERLDEIESEIYMSPGNYMLARNSSTIFSCIGFCKNELEKWYEIMKNKKRKRLVLLHNNLSINHVIKENDTKLISLNNMTRNIPIYDFINFYKNNYEKYDFNYLYDLYIKKFPLLEEEKMLLFIILFLPDKVYYNNSELKYTMDVSKLCNYLYTTDKLFMEQNSKDKKE